MDLPELDVFWRAEVSPAALRTWMTANELAVISCRNVTPRDATDNQQPTSLRVDGWVETALRKISASPTWAPAPPIAVSTAPASKLHKPGERIADARSFVDSTAMKGKGSKHAGKGSREAEASARLPTIRKILAPTDFSDHSRAGVRYAVRLAETLGAAIEVVYVIEPPPRMAGADMLVPVPQIAEVMPRVRAYLDQLVREEARGDVRLSLSVGVGTPWFEITTRARVGAMDLVVLATHGHTGIKHALLGSTAERVVRHAPCAVLTVPVGVVGRRAREAPMLKVKRILVPVDFSKVSKRAITVAAALARQFSAELTLLYVVEHLAIDRVLGLAQSAEALAASMKQARVELEAVAARVDEASGGKASATVRDGAPFREICDTAKRVGADLIVLTTRGLSGMTRVVLGSTAERVVRHAPCPVLSVRS